MTVLRPSHGVVYIGSWCVEGLKIKESSDILGHRICWLGALSCPVRTSVVPACGGEAGSEVVAGEVDKRGLGCTGTVELRVGMQDFKEGVREVSKTSSLVANGKEESGQGAALQPHGKPRELSAWL